MNPHESKARHEKAHKLATVLVRSGVEVGRVEQLVRRGDAALTEDGPYCSADEWWSNAAILADCTRPSQDTRELVIQKMRAMIEAQP